MSRLELCASLLKVYLWNIPQEEEEEEDEEETEDGDGDEEVEEWPPATSSSCSSSLFSNIEVKTISNHLIFVIVWLIEHQLTKFIFQNFDFLSF